MTEKINTTSCDPNIEHVIFDCEEVVHLHADIYVKLVYLQEDDISGQLIGVQACEKDGTPIDHGLIVILKNGIFYRQTHLNKERLSFMAFDEKGRIKILQ